MKPAELFPEAVVLRDFIPVIIDQYIDTKEICIQTTEAYKWVELTELQPLPISPAVLRGLGFEDGGNNEWKVNELFIEKSGKTYIVDYTMFEVKSAHQLQSLSLHLYGVELVWNQSEYETALKEDAK